MHISAKTLLLHGSHDGIVSYEHSKHLYKQLILSIASFTSRLEKIFYAGHSKILQFETFREKMVEFLYDLFPKYTQLLSNTYNDVTTEKEEDESSIGSPV